MKILTGNDLKNGRVVWWDGQGWSIHVEDAADVGDQAEAILAREDAACRVNGAYGPTARPDLTLRPADPTAGTWVI